MEYRSLKLLLGATLASLLLAIAGCFVFLSGSASATVSSTAPSIPATPTPDTCSYSWGEVSAPATNPDYDTYLSATSALSANDIWAVGSQSGQEDGPVTSYAVHWNGTNWTSVPIPAVSQTSKDALSSVTALSANNVWAVGTSCDNSTCATLIVKWDGTAFHIVPTPNVVSATNYLTDIEALLVNDIWAVGYTWTDISAHCCRPLILHWNGVSWSIIANPSDLDSQSAVLGSVTAISSTDIWAMGEYNNTGAGSLQGPVALHWNGTAWSLARVPYPYNASYIRIDGVTAVSGNDVWGVGSYTDIASGDDLPLIMHWNGSAWSIVSAPSHTGASQHDYLYSVSASSATDIWAVGSWFSHGMILPLYMHWNGTAWALVDSSYTGANGRVSGVVAISPTDVWSVGYAEAHGASGGNFAPYIEHFTLHCNTPTPIPSPTATATSTPTPEPPRCPGERFTDVCPGDYFYVPVLNLADLHVVSGYTTSPPCVNLPNTPCFKPNNSSSRGQIAKVIAIAAGFSERVTGQTFEDVIPGSTFYDYIERMASRGIISGYPCGEAGEPCVAPANLPYFRVASPVTRGQISKMVVGAFDFTEPVSGQAFADVPVGSTFYDFIDRMAARNIINGYPCGGAGEPCDSQNNPYFRPTNPVTRGQTAKIVYLSMLQVTPTPTSTPIATSTPTVTSTPLSSDTPTPTDTATPEETATTTPTATATP